MVDSIAIPPKETWRDPAGIMVATVAIGGAIYRIETIEHEGTLWLVPGWFAHDAEGWMTPERMVSLATVRHERVQAHDFQVVVNEPLPRDLHPPHDPLETAKLTTVIDTPALFFSIPNAH